MVRSTASLINYGQASAAPGPAGPWPSDFLNILTVFALFRRSSATATLLPRAGSAHGAAEPASQSDP